MTVMMKEKISEASQGEEEEHSTEWLKIFSQEAETEMTVALELAEEEEEDNIDFVDLCEELESLEREGDGANFHIQRAKLEAGEEAYQPGEQLEEAGDMSAGELAAAKLSQEEAEQQLDEETAELKSVAEWQLNAMRGENRKGDRVDLPIDKEEMQSRRLHKESQQVEQLEEVIEKIRRLDVEVSARRSQQREVEKRRNLP
jgi:hypothetical protein